MLSGPGGLASWLRTGTLPPPAGSVSLPLDVGTVTDVVPAHLRRAITTRDRHCAAPGCDVPAGRVSRASHHPAQRGRHDQPAELPAVVFFSPFDPGAPVGLDHHPERRRHHHRDQPRRPQTAQPQPTHSRLSRDGKTPGHSRDLHLVANLYLWNPKDQGLSGKRREARCDTVPRRHGVRRRGTGQSSLALANRADHSESRDGTAPRHVDRLRCSADHLSVFHSGLWPVSL